MDGKFLGKIAKVQFGIQDSNFGLFLNFSGPGCGISAFVVTWGLAIEPSQYSEWTENDRDAQLAELGRFVNRTLIDANVEDVADLAGIPVEVTIEGNLLKAWRILTEVI